MNRTGILLMGAGLLVATPAMAQDDDWGAEEEAGATEETEGGGAVGAAVGADAGGAMLGTWPQAAIERPYTRPQGTIAASLDFGVLQLTIPNPIGGDPISLTADQLGVGAAYGVSDNITAGLSYAFTLGLFDSDFEIKGPLTVWGGYQVVHNETLSIAATAAFGVNLANTDQMALAAGLGARYAITPTLGVFTGGPYGPGPVGQHLRVGLGGDATPVTFDVPVGVMFQATPQLNVNLMTALANIGISDSDTIVFGADYIPLSLGALFSVTSSIDAAAQFSLIDLKEIGFDLWTLTIGARWYN
jgi:hypothetical protein